jgi:hypothetical protein
MSEQTFQGNVRKRLRPLRVQRVSCAAISGIPDQAYCGPGAAGWLELKFKKRWPVRGGPLKVGLEREQWIFADEWWEAGGKSWVLAQVGGVMYLWPGNVAKELYEGVQEARGEEIARWWGKDWEELKKVLLYP